MTESNDVKCGLGFYGVGNVTGRGSHCRPTCCSEASVSFEAVSALLPGPAPAADRDSQDNGGSA